MLFTFGAKAQDGQFNIGANFGLPVGDASDVASFTLGVEVNYLFSVSDDFKVGPSLSYVHYTGKEVDITQGISLPGLDLGSLGTVDLDDSGFLPLSVAARYNVSDSFAFGLDLGYAIGVSPEGNDGGFYYRPLIGYHISEKIMLQATYSGVSVEGGSFSNIGLGVMFAL